MASTLTTAQHLPFTIAWTDATGAATTPTAGSITLGTTDATVATAGGVSPDATAGTITPLKAGTDALTATGPAGPIPLTGGAFTVTAAAPAAGTVTFGTPA